MKIEELIKTILAQNVFQKTTNGTPLNKKSNSVVVATINDVNNWHLNAVLCEQCGIIVSGLLIAGGCPNCNSDSFTENITSEYLLR